MRLYWGARGPKTSLTEEDISIEADSLHLLVSSLVDQVGEVSAHADIDSVLHLRCQGPQLLLVLLQGLLIELQTQGPQLRQRLEGLSKGQIGTFKSVFLCPPSAYHNL